jgi:dTDP-4-dehydrorhamnose reductase
MAVDSSILVLGHRGHLGQALLAAMGSSAEVIQGGREAFDLSKAAENPVSCLWPGESGLSPAQAEAKLCWIEGELKTGQADPDQVHAGLDTIGRTIARARSSVVINCAGYTDVDQAESQPELAMAVNGVAPGVIAKACQRSGKHLVHISTDYVFGGRRRTPYHENHRPDPVNLYGQSKLMGEQNVMQAMPGALVIRSAWLFGPGKIGFVDKVIQQARQGLELEVVSDQTGSPTYTPDLARAIIELVLSGGVRDFACGKLGPGQAGWSWPARPCALPGLTRIRCGPSLLTSSQARLKGRPIRYCSTGETPRKAGRGTPAVLAGRPEAAYQHMEESV